MARVYVCVPKNVIYIHKRGINIINISTTGQTMI